MARCHSPGAKARQPWLEPAARIAGDAIALIDRDVEFVAPRIFEQQVLAFDSAGFGPGQSDKPGDALIDVDHVFTGREALGELDIFGTDRPVAAGFAC